MRRHLLPFLLLVACNTGTEPVTPGGDTGGAADAFTFDLLADLGPELPPADHGTPPESRGVDEDAGLTACEPGPGCFLDPCDGNADCQSGWCVDHLGESVCTMPCAEECPAGWSCQQVAGTDPDVVFVCVSEHPVLCRPCADATGCGSPGAPDGVCLHYAGEGSFCGGACGGDGSCPEGFSCQEAETVDGVLLEQCVADNGQCPCTSTSAALGLWTPCAQTSDAGLCTGKRVCTAEGLSACDAAIPVPEVCNGLDEDCDGEVDEPALQEGVYVPVCDDGKPCTQDACLGQAGCDHVSLTGGECTDGDACTAGDHCVQGTCTGQAVTCDDGNPCTDDSCDGLGGCLAAPNAADCDDGDPCTAGDHCAAGICAGEAVDCQCQDDDDCAVLEDGDVCNGTLVCATDLVPHLCILEPGSQVSCPEPPAGPDALCLSATCDPLTGTCGFVPANEGKACEDGNACTFGDLCGDGNCEAGPLLACADGNPCTDDSCLPASGCSFLPNAAPCTDQNPCTNGDHCAGGACAHTSVTACNDGNPCTTDSCNPSTGGCLFIVNQEPCNDGNTCTTGDHCHLGDCIAGGTLPCSDGNVCTDDACHPATGCTFTPNAAPCTDLNPCSLGDHCQNGWCLPTSFENCNDLNVCTNDTCTATGACLHTPNAATCNDGDACTVTDQCAGGECLGTGSLACSDGNVCTDDACLPAVGCTFTVNSAPCDDGNACTPSSQCVQGACLGSGTASCSDGNPCTSDTCDPQAGCQSVPAAGPCSDGNACTVGDQCAGGLCQGTGSLSCNDGKPCTADACDPLLGCVAPLVPNCCGNGLVEAGESCDDGNLAAGDGCDGQCALESSGCVKLGVDVRTLEQPPSDWQLGYCNSAYCEDTPTVIPAGWHIATIAEVAHLATYVKFGSCAAYGICGSYWYGGGVLTSGCSMLHYTCPTGGCTAYTSHCYTQVLLIRDGKDGTCHTGP